jgi:peptidoglycan L-alanyl-D-glutamate endopeptidase CwlK
MKFSKRSQDNLNSVKPELIKLFTEVLALGIFDISITEGLRSQERQQELLDANLSKTLNSKHLTGDAVDVAIYKNGRIDYKDTLAYYVLAGVVYTIAKQQGIRIRWGGNWDRDSDFNDNTFNDLVHFELEEQ